MGMDINIWPTYPVKNTLPTYSLDMCPNFHSIFLGPFPEKYFYNGLFYYFCNNSYLELTIVIPVMSCYLILLWIQRPRTQRYLTTPQRGWGPAWDIFLHPRRSPLHDKERGQGLTLPPMGYRVLWLPWRGLRGPPPLRNQGRSHFWLHVAI